MNEQNSDDEDMARHQLDPGMAEHEVHQLDPGADGQA